MTKGRARATAGDVESNFRSNIVYWVEGFSLFKAGKRKRESRRMSNSD
jgi:hypothetical protein